MEIKVTINAPELVAAIHALANAMKNTGLSTLKKEEVSTLLVNNPESDIKASEIVKELSQKVKKEKQITLTDLRAEISAKIKEKAITNDDVRKSLENYGVSKLTELDSENYSLFRKELLG